MTLPKLVLFIIFIQPLIIIAQTSNACFSPTSAELSNLTMQLSSPLSGNLNVVFIEFTFPDHADQIEHYVSTSEYTFPGVYPDGSSIADDIANNGPIEKADLLGEATIHFFETMSHNNINVTFNYPRNPNRTDGMWYTVDNYSTAKSRLDQVLRSVYDEFPTIIDNATYLVFHSLAYKREGFPWVPTEVDDFELTNGTVIFDGPYAYGNFGNQHRPAVITHEIAHRIELALNSTGAPDLSLPDRGTDRTVSVSHPTHGTKSMYVLDSAFDLMYHNDPNSSHLSLYGQRPLISYDLMRFGWISQDEILEIDAGVITDLEDIKLYDVRKQLTATQRDNNSSDRGYRVVKIFYEKDYSSTRDEYLLLEYHKGTDYDSELSNYDEGIAEGILVWHIAEAARSHDPAIDILCAVPYNGFNYDAGTGNGAPLPNDSYPKTWENYTYGTDFTGIQKNDEYDWLNDLSLTVPRDISSGWGDPTNGGRQLYELTGVDGANWRRELPKKDDFFSDIPIKGHVNNKLLPTTRPSTRNWWGDHTNIGITDIRTINATEKYMMIDFSNNYWGGTISQNMVWDGDIVVQEDLTIESGVTLTVNAGTNIEIKNNAKIKVFGTLDVNGTSSNIVTLDFQSAASSNGIYLENGSHADIDYADIKNGYYGIRSSQADLSITNSEVYGVVYGLYLLNHNSTTFEAEILDNDISAGFNYGIYLYNSDGQIRNNDIHHGSRGIYCNNSSCPDLGGPGYFGLNTIRDTGYGIRAYNNSDPFVGKYNCIEQGGLNSFLNCSSYFIYASSNCDIDAENNWFGSDPPTSSKFYASSNSTVNYDPWHHSAPALKLAKSASSEEQLFDQQVVDNSVDDFNNSRIEGKKYHYDPNWPINWKLLYVRNLIFVNDYGFAREICKDLISEYPDSSLTINALNLLRKASRNDQEGFKSFLQEQINSNSKKELYGHMELILNNYNSEKGVRLASINNIISRYRNTNLEESALFQKFMYTYHDLNDVETATQISDQLDIRYPKSESAYEAHIILNDGKVRSGDEPNNAMNRLQKNEENDDIIEDYRLLGNYPNPFNPSTTIKYAMPFVSNVSLTIYDMTGKTIKSFEYNSQPAGVHSILWNGINENGTKVASGVYVYKLKATSLEGNGKVFMKTSKLSLLK